jgi:hypothetical protein
LNSFDHRCVLSLKFVTLPLGEEDAKIATEFLVSGSLKSALSANPAWFTPTRNQFQFAASHLECVTRMGAVFGTAI